jgi:hypothetical protein
LVQAHLTIAINLGSRADVTANSALATPAHGDEEPVTAQIAPGTEPQPTAQIDNLVSDDDEFTSVPSAAVAAPVIGDLWPTSVQTDGTSNGHTTLVG